MFCCCIFGVVRFFDGAADLFDACGGYGEVLLERRGWVLYVGRRLVITLSIIICPF